MTQVTWLVHKEILERMIYHRGGLPDRIEAAGHRVLLINWQPGHDLPAIDDLTGPVVLYGSHTFVKELYRTHDSSKLQPGSLGVNERTRASQYMSHLPLDWFLNQDATFMTWAMFKHRASTLFQQHKTDLLFARPDSGFKIFAGQRLQLDQLDLDIKTLDENSGVMNDTMILVNKGIDIQGEFRFVIADRQVVTGSEYRWDGKLDIRRDWPVECFELAQQVALHEWQVDIAYTCDVALTDQGPLLVELNGFSCAGMYACDMDIVVPAISNAAIKEFYGNDV